MIPDRDGNEFICFHCLLDNLLHRSNHEFLVVNLGLHYTNCVIKGSLLRVIHLERHYKLESAMLGSLPVIHFVFIEVGWTRHPNGTENAFVVTFCISPTFCFSSSISW